MDDDLYAVLGVARDADDRQLRSAYRRLVKEHHPDVGGSPERFRTIQQAYERLSSPQGRALYDAELDRPSPGTTGSGTGPAAGPGPRPTGPAASTARGPTGPPPAPGWVGDAAARVHQAREARQRLGFLLDQLVVADGILYSMYRDWTLQLSPSDRARLQAQHDEVADRTAEMLAEARHLAQLLGQDRSDWPTMPTVDAVFSPADEMGYDVPVRVWFNQPSDLLTGPLWLTPRLSLRLRGAWWAAAVLVASRLATAVLSPHVETAPATEFLTRATSAVPAAVALVVAALVGALAWPVLLAVGAVRRSLAPVPSRPLRWALGASVLGALSAAGWWWPSWYAALAWTAALAGTGALAALVRSALARWWVRWWTATVQVALDTQLRRLRSSRGPQHASRRERRRARRSGMGRT